MKEMIDDFLKNWIIENNIRNTFYAPYHYEAMEAFAKHYHQSKVNNGVLDDVISCKNCGSDKTKLIVEKRIYCDDCVCSYYL